MCECTPFFKYKPKKIVVRLWNFSKEQKENIIHDLEKSGLNVINKDKNGFLVWEKSKFNQIKILDRFDDLDKSLIEFPDFVEQCKKGVWWTDYWFDPKAECPTNRAIRFIKTINEVYDSKFSCGHCMRTRFFDLPK